MIYLSYASQLYEFQTEDQHPQVNGCDLTFAFHLHYFEVALFGYFFADLLQPLFDGTF